MQGEHAVSAETRASGFFSSPFSFMTRKKSEVQEERSPHPNHKLSSEGKDSGSSSGAKPTAQEDESLRNSGSKKTRGFFSSLVKLPSSILLRESSTASDPQGDPSPVHSHPPPVQPEAKEKQDNLASGNGSEVSKAASNFVLKFGKLLWEHLDLDKKDSVSLAQWKEVS